MSEWMPGVIRRPGPAPKQGYPWIGLEHPKRGDVKHSAEGSLAGLFSVLGGPRRASWHFSVAKNGDIYQHYELSALCWHAGDVDIDFPGDVEANADLVGIEHEGVAGELLTPEQQLATIHISRWCAHTSGYSQFARFTPGSSHWLLTEHNEVSDLPTACPSSRIPWTPLIANLTPQLPPPEEDEMALPFTIKLNTQETWLIGVGEPQRVTDPEALGELRNKGVVAQGPSIVVTKRALRQLGVPNSEIP